MATAYTSLLGLALPVTGELSGSWGDTVNTAITSLLDNAVAGTTSITADADITLTTTTGVANQARQAIILWNPASGTVTRNITAPAQSKIYTVINASGGTQSIVFRGAGPTTGVTIIKGESAVVAWNGTDFIKVSNTGGAGSFTNVTISGTTTLSALTASTALALDASKNVVSVTNTGTGNNVLSASPTLTGTVAGASLSLSSLTATRVPFAGVAGLLSDSANMTFNGTRLTVADLADSGLTSGRVTYASTGGALVDSANLTFDGTTLTATGLAGPFNGTVGATTPSTGNFTSLTENGSPVVVQTDIGTAPNEIPLNQYLGNLAYQDAANIAGPVGIGTAASALGGRLQVIGNGDPVINTIGIRAGLANHTPSTPTKQFGIYVEQRGGRYAPQTGIYIDTRVGQQLFGGPYFGLEAFAQSSSQAYQVATGVYGQAENTVANFGTQAYGVRGVGISGSGGGPEISIGQGSWGGHFTGYGRGNTVGVYADAYLQASPIAGAVAIPLLVATNGTELMRVTSSGNLGIGTSSPATQLDVSSNTGTEIITRRNGGRTVNTYADAVNAILAYSTGALRIGETTSTVGNNFTERMRLDSSGNLGIGTTSPQDTLDITRASGTTAIRIASQGAGSLTWRLASQLVGVANAGFVIRDETNGVNRLAIDGAGNVGIGTSSPISRLQSVDGDITVTTSGSFSGFNSTRAFTPSAVGQQLGRLHFSAYSTGTTYVQGASIQSFSSAAWSSTSAPSYLSFQTTASGSTSLTERMVIDASGNLGLGVTPSAWFTGKAFQIGNSTAFYEYAVVGNRQSRFYNNGYLNASGVETYLNTDPATQYRQDTGVHKWFTAPSGTAGNAISFTQAMTLTAGGALLVGNTSAISSERLQTLNTNSGAVTLAARFINGGTATGTGSRIAFSGQIGSGGSFDDIALIDGIATGTSAGALVFRTNNAGNFDERARITSGGDLLVGTTSTPNGGSVFYVAGGGTILTTQTTVSTACNHIVFRNSNGNVGNIQTSGTATAFNTSSDYRLKNITGPITTSGAYIDSLNPVEGTWKADGSTFVGLIAHEVQEASRTPVATGVKDGEEMQGMDYSSAEIIANLIAEVKSLRQRLAALESN